MLWVVFDYSQTRVFVCCLIKRSTLQKQRVTLHKCKRKTETSVDFFPMSKMNVEARKQYCTYQMQNMQGTHILKDILLILI